MDRLRILALLIVSSCAVPATAADAERGEQLYANHCTACHESNAHIREGRKTDTPGALREWIERWRRHLELDWARSEIADVAAYLDQRYYRFKDR
jgi:mono/diheme cytochrome c family protein